MFLLGLLLEGKAMAENCILKFKTDDGHVVQVGDMGKTLIRDLGTASTADELEPNFFYARDYDGTDGNKLGEISNIQVEPTWSGDTDTLKAGDAIAFGTDDLLI